MADATTHTELFKHTRGEDAITGKLMPAPELACRLNHEYYLQAYPDFYFIVRSDLHSKDEELERVCLYRKGVVNEHLRGDAKPFTNWISNELRDGRKIEDINRDMEAKAAEITRIVKTKK